MNSSTLEYACWRPRTGKWEVRRGEELSTIKYYKELEVRERSVNES